MKVVAVGGGHGLASTLEATRHYADDITAIVSVADDGGSSGRLRAAFGIPSPGDLRRCLVALARNPLWTAAFEHRFAAGELEGHAFGNLVIAGLADSTGDFALALAEAGTVLGAVGRVLPATCEPVELKAVVAAADGEPEHFVQGQLKVANTARITGVSLVPADPEASPAALEAIAGADQIILGPGSLFTSVLAAVVVPGIRAALAATAATKVYVCNLREQVPETAGFDVAAHVAALRAHGVDIDVVVCHPGALPEGDLDVKRLEMPVARPDGTAHDPVRLATALRNLVG